LGPQKVKKHAKNDLTAPFLDTQVAALGECNFVEVNGHQIGKFYLGWKVDMQGFPTSQPKLNLDVRKYPKSRWKGA